MTFILPGFDGFVQIELFGVFVEYENMELFIRTFDDVRHSVTVYVGGYI